jgi:hypothetical protein
MTFGIRLTISGRHGRKKAPSERGPERGKEERACAGGQKKRAKPG